MVSSVQCYDCSCIMGEVMYSSQEEIEYEVSRLNPSWSSMIVFSSESILGFDWTWRKFSPPLPLPKPSKHHSSVFEDTAFNEKRKNEILRKTHTLSILLTDQKHFPIEKYLNAEETLSNFIVDFLQRKDILLCFPYVWLKYICFMRWKKIGSAMCMYIGRFSPVGLKEWSLVFPH